MIDKDGFLFSPERTRSQLPNIEPPRKISDREKRLQDIAETMGKSNETIDLLMELVEKYEEKLRASLELEQNLQREFKAYRDTAEEIHQNYIYQHSDSWVFEQALRRIANKSLEDSDNLGESSVEEQREVALKALEAVWKRREERSRQTLSTEGFAE